MGDPDLSTARHVTTAPSRWLRILMGCLLLLGVGAQSWLCYELRYDLPVLMRGDPMSVAANILLSFSPILLAIVSAVLAMWLARRGSRGAMVTAGVPCAILAFGIGLAVYLTVNPISLHQP